MVCSSPSPCLHLRSLFTISEMILEELQCWFCHFTFVFDFNDDGDKGNREDRSSSFSKLHRLYDFCILCLMLVDNHNR
ncbi:hypothetical protein PIB30_000742 [Stylosanthes scabra]|uniref:Uncharacterized protein n=1 Tax=Stylosanthes scabra TaxID=79078 RepID=A0ABU6Z1C3_9FABA|nr:hypothetical protein [Stylosanthes scabra]